MVEHILDGQKHYISVMVTKTKKETRLCVLLSLPLPFFWSLRPPGTTLTSPLCYIWPDIALLVDCHRERILTTSQTTFELSDQKQQFVHITAQIFRSI
ncbi:hypothetical protein AVEN_178840-1 [Araneus ventricosus]|uniref:Uncharacterized protein n=1 Tax=Araneus ventricosus TaxID=182803 RepID=A0A4Y2BFT1_ARAVE|nr:hypothetical protein AVEN_178840-1 [Araneus ventricosus]